MLKKEGKVIAIIIVGEKEIKIDSSYKADKGTGRRMATYPQEIYDLMQNGNNKVKQLYIYDGDCIETIL